MSLARKAKAQRDAQILKTEQDFTNLCNLKIKLFHAGRIEQSETIQAAINVGFYLHWTKEHVMDLVVEMEDYLADEGPIIGGDLMCVRAEEDLLQFSRDRLLAASWDSGFTTIMDLREEYAPPHPATIQGEGDGARVGAPLLLMKIQAALNTTFWEMWTSLNGSARSSTHHDMVNELSAGDVDPLVFRLKVATLFRAPTRLCGEEILYLLQMSKLGSVRFPPLTKVDRAIVAPGIERGLHASEKDRWLRIFLRDMVQGERILLALWEVLRGPDTDRKYTSIRACYMAEMGDEVFLILDYLYMACFDGPRNLSGHAAGQSNKTSAIGHDKKEMKRLRKGEREEQQKLSLLITLKVKG